MKNIKKNSLINSFIFSKICVGSSMAYTDPTNFNVLLGYRKSLFALINPFSFQYSLKTCFIFLLYKKLRGFLSKPIVCPAPEKTVSKPVEK